MEHQTQKRHFLFAYEEALGYMFGHRIWDKDGLSTLLVFLDLCTHLQAHHQTVWQRLEQLYRKHDLHMHQQVTLSLTDSNQDLLTQLRKKDQFDFADYTLDSFCDFLQDPEQPYDMITFYYPPVRVTLRLSGTEPKLKCYYEWVEPVHDKIHFLSLEHITEKKLLTFIEQHQAFLLQCS